MNYKRRLAEYQEWATRPIPPELVSVFISAQDKFLSFLKLAWDTEDSLRSFSPLAKGFLKPKQIVYGTQGFIPQEKAYIKQFAQVLFQVYGDPVTEYTGFNNSVPAVRQFQALQRFSPKVTPGANKRRFENLQSYFGEKIFKPDIRIWEKTIQMAREILNLPKVNINFSPHYVRGLFAGHASNVGYPFFQNELTESNGISFRDKTVQVTNELIKKYNSCKWMATIPAVIIGRDQPGGNTLDLTKKYTRESLLKALDNIEYKPSKARPVWAIPRITNNVVAPVLKGIIKHPHFLNNPQFCGFLSREDRYKYMQRFDQYARSKGLIPINVDFKSFDTTISAPLLLTALDLGFETVNISNAPADILDSIKASAIFTTAIAKDPASNSIFKKTKTAAIASGHGTTGFSGYICAFLVMLYAAIIIYGEEWVRTIHIETKSKGTAYSFGLGDDYLGLFKSVDDIKRFSDIVKQTFGMIIETDSIKTSIGTDFLQELYWGGNIEYPIGRLAPSALYTERSSGKGFAMWDMAYSSMIYNIRTNPESSLDLVTSIFQALDSTDLGLKNIDGQDISPSKFIEYLKRECAARNATPKDLLWDGDPAKENKFSTDGDLKSDYLQWWFSLIRRALHSNGALSTSALRRFWSKWKH